MLNNFPQSTWLGSSRTRVQTHSILLITALYKLSRSYHGTRICPHCWPLWNTQGSYVLLHHILLWLPVAIRINKVIRHLPFFAFLISSCEYFLASPLAQDMPDDLKICKHTIFFHLSSCLHVWLPQLGTSFLPQNSARSCASGFVKLLWITPREQAPPTLGTPTHRPLLQDSIMHDSPHCSYLVVQESMSNWRAVSLACDHWRDEPLMQN